MTRPSEPALVITAASDAEKTWAADLMAASEPWQSLGVSRAECLEAVSRPDLETYVARRNSRPAGLIVLQRYGVASAPYVKSIAVAPDARGVGVGSALLDFAEARFASEARFLFICVSSFNTRARALYERRGFQQVADLDGHVVDGASEILLRKRLSKPCR